MDVREKLSSEKQLIDAKVFAEHLERMARTAYQNLSPGLFEAAEYVKDFPTVDAVEVVHGRWRCHGDCGVTECSVCGWSIEEYVGDYAYCPNCGAKMDLEG